MQKEKAALFAAAVFCKFHLPASFIVLYHLEDDNAGSSPG
jgi:hypothetical protein